MYHVLKAVCFKKVILRKQEIVSDLIMQFINQEANQMEPKALNFLTFS